MKDCRYEASSANLKLTQLDWNLFLKRIVTGDETWIHHYDPESKQQSMQWKHATLSESPEVQGAGISWQGCVHYFLGCWRCTADWLYALTRRQLQGFTTVTYFTNCFLQLKRSGEESCPRRRYFCTTMHLLISRMLDRLHYLNPDLKKCAIQHILLIWHRVITIYFQM